MTFKLFPDVFSFQNNFAIVLLQDLFPNPIKIRSF